MDSTPAWTHTFVEIDDEKFSTVIHLLSLIQEGMLLVTSKRTFTCMCTKYWLTAWTKLAREKIMVRKTDSRDMTAAVDWDVEPQTKQKSDVRDPVRREQFAEETFPIEWFSYQ